MQTCRKIFLSQLQQLSLNIVLYRDDGLAVVNSTPKVIENIKKDICRIFNNNRIRINIEANKKIINFLDITFYLNQCTYQPYTKSNTTINYVHHDSNHPPCAIKAISAGINRRLSYLSFNKASSDQATPPYQNASDESG